MVEFALFVCVALQSSVKIFTRELAVHVQAFVVLRTAVFHEELAEFRFVRRKDVMGVWAVGSL